MELFKRHNITKLYFRKLTITITDKGYISDSDTTIYKSLNALTVAYFKLHSSGSSCNVWVNVYFEKDGKKILIQNIRYQ